MHPPRGVHVPVKKGYACKVPALTPRAVRVVRLMGISELFVYLKLFQQATAVERLNRRR